MRTYNLFLYDALNALISRVDITVNGNVLDAMVSARSVMDSTPGCIVVSVLSDGHQVGTVFDKQCVIQRVYKFHRKKATDARRAFYVDDVVQYQLFGYDNDMVEFKLQPDVKGNYNF